MLRIVKILVWGSCLAALAGCASGKSAFSKAERLESDGRLDEAVMKYGEAAVNNPSIGEYRMRFLSVSATAARIHLKKGDELAGAKDLDGALREYQAAVALDPSLSQALHQVERVTKLRNAQVYYREGDELERTHKLREAMTAYKHALDLNPDNAEAKEAYTRVMKSSKPKLEGFELNLKSTKPITLKFKDARIKDVFTILGQLSGINFTFDDAVKDQNVTIFLENATFYQALDILTSVHKLSRKVLNESTIIIYPKTQEKAKQYEDLVVQTFYLDKLDAKKAVNLIRTMLQVKKIYVNEEINAIVIRDTPEVVEVARKILEANDVPDAEVILDVEVIEVTKNNTEAFGLALSRYAVSFNTLTPSGQFFSDSLTTTSSNSSTTTTTSANTGNLLQLFQTRSGYGGFITVPSATYSFGKTLANGETLANPKIRIKNREKSKFNVGTRVPITTTSSPVGGGVSVNVQYVDVGVKVNAEPVIQLNNDVSIKLGLEVSSILSTSTVGGTDSATTVVTIGTRNLDTVLNLKDGETSIIGGLLQNNKTNNTKKISIIGDIPIIGPLLSGKDKTDNKTELILAITPHIVRGITVPDADTTMFWSGKEDEPVVGTPFASFVQEPDFGTGQAAPAAPAPPAAKGAKPAPAGAPQPQAAPAPSPTPGTAAVPPATPAAPAPAAAPASKASLTITAPRTVKVGEQFTVEVKVASAKDLASAPFTFIFDPIFVDILGVAEGGLFRSDGKESVYKSQVNNAKGQVAITLSRPSGAPGVNGDGTLLFGTFKAKNKGPANFGIMNPRFSASAGAPIETSSFNTVVDVQ